jgi:hypothetical protein
MDFTTLGRDHFCRHVRQHQMKEATMSDPKLKTAMAEIFTILKRHDLGGTVTLVSPTHSEFRVREDPSWSCCTIENESEVRFQARRADFKTKEEWHRTIQLTAHLVAQIRDFAGVTFKAFDVMYNELDRRIGIEHVAFAGFERHEEH